MDREQLTDLVLDVAAALQKDGVHARLEEINEWGTFAHMALGRPYVGLTFAPYDQRGEQRIKIRARFPQPPDFLGSNTYLHYDEEYPSITVAARRPAYAIANGIQRRLLPEYKEMVEEVREREASMLKSARAQHETGRRLAEAIGAVPPKKGSDRFRLNSQEVGVMGEVQYGGDTASVHLRWISVEDAEVILQVARKLLNAKKELQHDEQ